MTAIFVLSVISAVLRWWAQQPAAGQLFLLLVGAATLIGGGGAILCLVLYRRQAQDIKRRREMARQQELARQLEQARQEEMARRLANGERSRHIPKDVQREVWERDGGRCVECDSTVELEFDHLIPFSKGGSHTAENIRVLCRTCNRRKSDRVGA